MAIIEIINTPAITGIRNAVKCHTNDILVELGGRVLIFLQAMRPAYFSISTTGWYNQEENKMIEKHVVRGSECPRTVSVENKRIILLETYTKGKAIYNFFYSLNFILMLC